MSATRNRLLSLSTGCMFAVLGAVWIATPAATAAPARASGATQAVLAPDGHLLLPDGTRLRFTGVSEDSRCPKDALCVWPGRAVVALGLTTAEGANHDVEIQYQGQPTTKTVDGVALTVSDVQPYPASTAPIEPHDYRVTVSIGAVKITAADFGSTVSVSVGQTVVVDPGGDYVDYIWKAHAVDPTILEPLPQILIFPPPPPAFKAIAPGATTLRIVREDPCRYSTPPCLLPEQIFEVEVVVR